MSEKQLSHNPYNPQDQYSQFEQSQQIPYSQQYPYNNYQVQNNEYYSQHSHNNKTSDIIQDVLNALKPDGKNYKDEIGKLTKKISNIKDSVEDIRDLVKQVPKISSNTFDVKTDYTNQLNHILSIIYKNTEHQESFKKSLEDIMKNTTLTVAEKLDQIKSALQSNNSTSDIITDHASAAFLSQSIYDIAVMQDFTKGPYLAVAKQQYDEFHKQLSAYQQYISDITTNRIISTDTVKLLFAYATMILSWTVIFPLYLSRMISDDFYWNPQSFVKKLEYLDKQMEEALKKNDEVEVIKLSREIRRTINSAVGINLFIGDQRQGFANFFKSLQKNTLDIVVDKELKMIETSGTNVGDDKLSNIELTDVFYDQNAPSLSFLTQQSVMQTLYQDFTGNVVWPQRLESYLKYLQKKLKSESKDGKIHFNISYNLQKKGFSQDKIDVAAFYIKIRSRTILSPEEKDKFADIIDKNFPNFFNTYFPHTKQQFRDALDNPWNNYDDYNVLTNHFVAEVKNHRTYNTCIKAHKALLASEKTLQDFTNAPTVDMNNTQQLSDVMRIMKTQPFRDYKEQTLDLLQKKQGKNDSIVVLYAAQMEIDQYKQQLSQELTNVNQRLQAIHEKMSNLLNKDVWYQGELDNNKLDIEDELRKLLNDVRLIYTNNSHGLQNLNVKYSLHLEELKKKYSKDSKDYYALSAEADRALNDIASMGNINDNYFDNNEIFQNIINHDLINVNNKNFITIADRQNVHDIQFNQNNLLAQRDLLREQQTLYGQFGQFWKNMQPPTSPVQIVNPAYGYQMPWQIPQQNHSHQQNINSQQANNPYNAVNSQAIKQNNQYVPSNANLFRETAQKYGPPYNLQTNKQNVHEQYKNSHQQGDLQGQ